MPQIKTEKRIYRRFDFNGNVDFKTRGDRRSLIRAYLNDISLSGLRMRSEEEMPVGKKVVFEVTTPSLKDSLVGKGRIRHVTLIKRYGGDFFYIGVEFERVKRNRIKELIERTYRTRKKSFLSRQHRREMSFMLRILPFLILAASLTVEVANIINDRITKNSAYVERVEEGAIYYLYH